MKKLSLLPSILAIILSSIALMTPFEKEIAYVDINRVFENYDRTAVLQKELDLKTTPMRANVDSLLNDWQEELRIYEKERPGMTQKELELKQQLLQNKQHQLNNYQKAVEQKILEEDQKMSQNVINDINEFVKEYGQKKGYKIIHGATGSGNIMYAEESVNVTEAILKELNNRFMKK